MNPSLFIEFVEKYFRAVLGMISEKFNGRNTEETLLHKTMLVEEYSPDLKYESTELNHSIVAADVVSLDSSLPLKKRGTLKTASGLLPKIGMKFRKGERDLTNINIMIARGTNEATIASKIFDDAGKAVKGIEVRNEIMFLEGLSTGYALVTDDNNNGTGVRLNFGYKEENLSHATIAWGETGYTPVDDIRKIFDNASAKGYSLAHVYMSKKYFDFLRASAQGKELAAAFGGQVITTTAVLPVPGRNTMLEALADEFGATFHYIDSSFLVENTDGTKTAIKPWAEGNIVGVPAEKVGRMVYGTLAEETNPVEGVNYEKSGSYILVSKYSKNDPLEEFTASQAICAPIIDGADGIFSLHADSATAGLSVEDSSVSFTSAAATKETEVHYDGALNDLTITQTNNTSWLTVTRRGNVVKLKVTSNSGSQRTSTVTISDGTNSATIAVTQAA